MPKDGFADLFRLVYDRDKMVLIAYYLLGWSGPETAKELGISRERVYQIRNRAIKRLGISKGRLDILYSIHRIGRNRRQAK